MEQTKSKKIVMASTCAIAAAGFAVVSLATPFTAQRELTATGTERSISYASGVNQTTMGSQVETTSGITNGDSGTRVLTTTSTEGESATYGTGSSYYCKVIANKTGTTTSGNTSGSVVICADIHNVTSVTATFSVTCSLSGNALYRPWVAFNSKKGLKGTYSSTIFFCSDEATTNDGNTYTKTIAAADQSLSFVPESVKIQFGYNNPNYGDLAAIIVNSVSISWTC